MPQRKQANLLYATAECRSFLQNRWDILGAGEQADDDNKIDRGPLDTAGFFFFVL